MYLRGLLFILIALTLVSCFTNRNHSVLEHHLNPQEEAGKFIDSLKLVKVDTIIGCYNGCSGCVSGVVTDYYVFWIKDRESFITKFNEISNYNSFRISSLPIGYFSSILIELKNEKLNKPKYTSSHYGYEIVNITLNDKQIYFEVLDFEKETNEEMLRVLLIDKIRSNLFDISKEEWKGLNYKSKKVRNRF